MFHDACKELCERLVLVSGDSDLVPALAMVKQNYPEKELVVYIPARNAARGAAVELRSIADKHKTLPLQMLRAAQFPATIPCGSAPPIKKPPHW
jgi:uncharacterized LabA/DUF88 family protein